MTIQIQESNLIDLRERKRERNKSKAQKATFEKAIHLASSSYTIFFLCVIKSNFAAKANANKLN